MLPNHPPEGQQVAPGSTRAAVLCTALSLFVVVIGCRPDEVESQPIDEPVTDSANPPPPDPTADGADGVDGTAGDAPQRQRVCSVYTGDDAIVQGDTFRHHCSGVMRSNVKARLAIMEEQVDQEVLDYIESNGLGEQENFGPNYGASFEDPAVVACCEHEYGYPNTPQPDDYDAEHGWACAVDCLDQTCRAIPGILRDLAEGPYKVHLKNHPFPCAVDGDLPCYYDELWALSNYIAGHHQQCVEAFLHDKPPPYIYQVSGLGGELDFDAWIAENDPGAADAWPTITNVFIEGECGIDPPDATAGSGWQIPPGPLQPCTDSNDNNDEDPFGSGHGGGFLGPDTFLASSGTLGLDGPTLMAFDLGGASPMKGTSSSNCEHEPCTWLSLGVRHGILRLQDLQILVPEGLGLVHQAPALAAKGFRLHIDHPEEALLVPGVAGISTFSFATGTVKAIASGKLLGLPGFSEVWNTTPLQGTITEIGSDSFEVTLDPVTFARQDGFGNPWQLEATFGPWLAHRRAPRARFDITHVGDFAHLDASTSSDADGDPLTFTWYVDGVAAGGGRLLRVPWDPQAIHVVVLHVADPTGRDDRARRLLAP
jgi:hypothetical protein